LFKYFFLVSWGYPLCCACICLAMDWYGPSGAWCWISDPHADIRLLFYFGVMWACWVFNAIAFVLIVRRLRHINADIEEANRQANLTIPVGVGISVGHKGSVIGVEGIQGIQGVQGFNHHRKRIMINYRSLFYVIVFIVCWIPGSLQRAQQMDDPNHPLFILMVLHSFFTPSVGFFNFLVWGIFELRVASAESRLERNSRSNGASAKSSDKTKHPQNNDKPIGSAQPGAVSATGPTALTTAHTSSSASAAATADASHHAANHNNHLRNLPHGKVHEFDDRHTHHHHGHIGDHRAELVAHSLVGSPIASRTELELSESSRDSRRARLERAPTSDSIISPAWNQSYISHDFTHRPNQSVSFTASHVT